jgi:integrase
MFQHRRPEMPTFGSWVELCLENVTRRRLRERDAALLRSALRRWRDRALDRIARADCECMTRDYGDAFGTVWLRCVTVRRIFRRAVEAGLIATNPWDGVTLPKPLIRGRVLTHGEQAELRCRMGEPWTRLVTVGVGTGLRPAELLRLGPAHRAGIMLRLTADITSDGHARLIPLRAEVVRALDEQTPLAVSGKYWACRQVLADDVLRQMSMSLGWPQLTLRDLRRTFGTRSAEAGMPMARLQAIMGHSSPRTTAIYYAHLVECS